MNWFTDPLSFEFMRHAVLLAVLMGILCPVVGSYLIVQRMGLLGDVIAHAVLPGLAIAFYLGIDIFLGAFISGTLSTLISECSFGGGDCVDGFGVIYSGFAVQSFSGDFNPSGSKQSPIYSSKVQTMETIRVIILD